MNRDMLFSEVNERKITCSNVVFHTNGMQSVYVNYNNNRLICQTDAVIATSLDSDSIKMKISNELTSFIRAVDKVVIQHAKMHSLQWFDKNLDENDIHNMFVSTVSEELMSLKIIETDVFDKHKGLRDVSYIDRSCKCIIMIELVGVYFAKRRFGVTWNAKQILAYPTERLYKGYAFRDDEDPVPI